MLTRVLRCAYTPTRKMKTYIPKVYEAIPHHYKPIFIDIHDSYKLRSKEQLKKQLDGLKFRYDITLARAPGVPDRQFIERKVILQFDLVPFKFTKLQRDRLRLLMGPRYRADHQYQKITVDMYDTMEKNLEKARQMMYELIVEAKRAP